MSDQVQFRGGTTTQHSAFTGASREITVDTTKSTAVVHDGATAGGHPLLREDLANFPGTQTVVATQVGSQQSAYTVATAGGTADAITANFTPAIAALTDGMELEVRCPSTNASTTPTLQANATAAKTIVKGNNLALAAGDIPLRAKFKYDATLDKWVLINPAGGVTTRGVQTFTSNGNFTVPAGVSTIYVSGCAAGGGGGAGGSSAGSTNLVGGGGGAGGSAGQSIIRQAYSVTPGQVIPITIGGGGTAGAAAASGNNTGGTGGAGGNTVVGSLVTLTAASVSGGGGGCALNAGVGSGGAGGVPGATGYPRGSYGSDGNYTGNGGPGASSPFGGGGGGARAASSAGYSAFAASGYGAGGGGGGACYGGAAGPGGNGGAGAPGIVIIEW